MTGPEQRQLNDLYQFVVPMLNGINKKLDDLSDRVVSLEQTRAVEEAVEGERQRVGEEGSSLHRWRIATIIAAVCSGGLLAIEVIRLVAIHSA